MKTLVDQLREMVEKSREDGGFPTDFSEQLIGCRVERSEEERELFSAIANRIEREYLPRPRFEDEEPIKVGDMILWNDGGAKRVKDIKVEVQLEDSCVTFSSVLKRYEDTLERIDADAMKMFNDYWACGDAECSCCPAIVDGKKPYERYCTDGCAAAQRLDLLHRQRELLERGQE